MSFFLIVLEYFRGAINFNDLLKSSESDVAAIEKLQPTISPDSGANIQFTSGTTGKPKAALVSHFSIVNNGFDTGKNIFSVNEIRTKYFREVQSPENRFHFFLKWFCLLDFFR